MAEAHISSVVAELLEFYRLDLGEVVAELGGSPDPLRRESLLEAKEGLEFVIGQVASIRDVATAFIVSQSLAQRIEGLQPAIIVQIVEHARQSIADRLLAPVHATVPHAQGREAAVRFLAGQLTDSDRRAILSDITRLGFEQWVTRHHMPFGMGVRNKLRAAGFTEQVLGVDSLDEIWATLLHAALRTDA